MYAFIVCVYCDVCVCVHCIHLLIFPPCFNNLILYIYLHTYIYLYRLVEGAAYHDFLFEKVDNI